MSNKRDFRIDPRTESDLRGQIARLAQSYTPEWAFHPENPDIGSVIGLLFASQLAGNIRRLNQVVEKYHTEFINLLDLSLQAAFPAVGVAVFDMIPDTVSGVLLPRGVKLLAAGEDESRVVFETQNEVFVTGAMLTDIVGVSGTHGCIRPLRGGWQAEPLLPEALLRNPVIEEAAAPEAPVIPMLDELTEEESLPSEKPISLFDYSEGNIARSALILYHNSLFDTAEGVSIMVYAYDPVTGDSLADYLSDPSCFRWSYLSEDGLQPIDARVGEDGGVILTRGGENRHVRIAGEEYAVLCAEACSVPRSGVDFGRLEVSSSCEQTPPEGIIHNDEQLDCDSCLPFGQTASIFDECYISHDRIFRQQGAEIELTFTLDYEDKLVDLLPAQEEEALKIIKRRPRPTQIGRADTRVQRMAIEYFNGRGWYRLPVTADWQTLFDGSRDGDVVIRFDCPDDWQPSVIGGLEGRMIRLRVMQADNCFLQPCLHHMPRMLHVRLRYRYTGFRRLPQRVERICGTLREDVTRLVHSRQTFTAFSALPYYDNSLLLGFDKPFGGSPVSLFFDIEENVHFESESIQFYYSTDAGFKRLRVVDGTRAMRQAGIVQFYPPHDFAPIPVEGRRRFWLRLTDETGAFDQEDRYRAVIRGLLTNAVEVRNIETLPEKQFYIEHAVPNMSFSLEADNILSAEVFVNEFGALTQLEMRDMLAAQPDNVRVEYNLIGEISAFFVRWNEVDSFDQSKPEDRHYLIDRMLGLLRFGDGVRVRIPRAQDNVAVTARVMRCEGMRGNLPAGTVNRTYGNMMYIDRVYNPVATSAGSNIESVESARLRGTNLISAQNRLVSPLDFQRAVQAYSAVVAKVKCISGRAPSGRRDSRLVSVVVMMQDYQAGSYSFNNLKKPLGEFLLSRCEATVAPDDFYLTEPMYIELSVDVWVETTHQDMAFQIQRMLSARIRELLDPLGTPGWDIGTLPDEHWIGMQLRTAKVDAVIRRFCVSARRVEQDGVHECSLSELPQTPFMIGVNGQHRVHVSFVG